jgi:rubrerythrin
MTLKGTTTEANLRRAFAREGEANRRYLYFAQQADVEGLPEIASLFKNVADGETGHAHGHLEFLATLGSGDPATGMAIGDTEDNLKSAVASEVYESTEMYPAFATCARGEGFTQVAEWFDTLARAEKSHAGRFQQGLDSLHELTESG